MCSMFKWAVRKAFSPSLPSLMLFSASISPSLARAVGLECFTRSWSGHSLVSQQLLQVSWPLVTLRWELRHAHFYRAPLSLAEVLALSLKSHNTAGWPSNCSGLLTILKGTCELCDWTSIGNAKELKGTEKLHPAHGCGAPAWTDRKALHAELLSFVMMVFLSPPQGISVS